MKPVHGLAVCCFVGSCALEVAFSASASAVTPIGWSAERWLRDDTTASPGAGSINASELTVIVRGGDGALYETSYQPRYGGWSQTWTALGFSVPSGADVAYPIYDDGVSGDSVTEVVYRGTNNRIYRLWRDWSGDWHRESLGGNMRGNPEVVIDYRGTHVFARGANNHLYYGNHDGFEWSGFTDLGGTLTSDPAAAASYWGATPRLDIAVRGSDGAILHRRYEPNTGFTAFKKIAAQTVKGAPAIVSWAGEVHVLARNSQDQLLHTRLANGTWTGSYVNLGGQLTSEPEAASSVAGRLDVFYRDANGSTMTRSYREDFGPRTITVMQYNIYGWVGNADSEAEIDALSDHVSEEILDRGVALASLNEVCVMEYYGILSRLGDTYGGLAYLPHFDRLDSKPACGGGFGNAIVYDVNVLGYAVQGPLVELNEQPEPRYLNCAEFPRRELVLCTTHLTAAPGSAGEAEREESINRILFTLQGYEDAGWQVMLAGDLNMTAQHDFLDGVYSPSYGYGAWGDFREGEAYRNESPVVMGEEVIEPAVEPTTGNIFNERKIDYIFGNYELDSLEKLEIVKTDFSDHRMYLARAGLR